MANSSAETELRRYIQMLRMRLAYCQKLLKKIVSDKRRRAAVGILAVCLLQGCDDAPHNGLQFTDNQIAQAIYLAEGGEHASRPYGISSVSCEDRWSCRRICLNTIRNNRRRYAKTSRAVDFITYLGSRYSPASTASFYVDGQEADKSWVRNVKFFLRKRCEQDLISC